MCVLDIDNASVLTPVAFSSQNPKGKFKHEFYSPKLPNGDGYTLPAGAVSVFLKTGETTDKYLSSRHTPPPPPAAGGGGGGGDSSGDESGLPQPSPYRVEPAKTSRARCKRCDGLITANTLRVGLKPLFRGKPGFLIWYHLR